MRHVLDCSVALKWFFEERLSDRAAVLLERLQQGAVELIAPDCIVPEMGHSCRKLVLGGKMSVADACAAVEEFTALPIQIVPSRSIASDAMTLALKHMGTFYDALYVALAVREGLRVVTADDRMTNAFRAVDRTDRLEAFE